MAKIRVGKSRKVCLEEMNLFFKKVERGHIYCKRSSIGVYGGKNNYNKIKE